MKLKGSSSISQRDREKENAMVPPALCKVMEVWLLSSVLLKIQGLSLRSRFIGPTGQTRHLGLTLAEGRALVAFRHFIAPSPFVTLALHGGKVNVLR